MEWYYLTGFYPLPSLVVIDWGGSVGYTRAGKNEVVRKNSGFR
jgi:hypothetical protein